MTLRLGGFDGFAIGAGLMAWRSCFSMKTARKAATVLDLFIFGHDS
jgi:hypothetical protein